MFVILLEYLDVRGANILHIVLKADYSSALSMLLRYPSPQPDSPQTFVRDALYLEQNPNAERGSFLISKYSGRQPESSKRHDQSGIRPARKAHLWEEFKSRSESSSSAQSPARDSPKSLEALLQDVSQGIQRRTESWGVAKAVRGAVTEARRNMQTMHYEPGPRFTAPKPTPSATTASHAALKTPTATELGLGKKISLLEERNKTLATALGDALEDLRSQLATTKELDSSFKDAVKQALARAESVQGCLEDSALSLPVVTAPESPPVDNETARPKSSSSGSNTAGRSEDVAQRDPPVSPPHPHADVTGPSAENGTSKPVSIATAERVNGQAEAGREGPRSNMRPSLTDAGFSWMLQGSRNLTSFVSSASVPPEQTRHQEHPQGKGSALFGNLGDENPGTDAEHDELALQSLRGARGPP